MESDFIEKMEPSSEVSEDVDRRETNIYGDTDFTDSDSDSDGEINGLEMLEPDPVIDEPDEDFTLDMMNSLNHDVPDIETIRKYSEMLFGISEGRTNCDHCEFGSENILELKLHMASAHDGLQVHCIQCDFTATRRDTLLNHVRKVHEGKGFPCEQCEYIAGTRQHLQRHVKGVHEGVKRMGTPRKKDGEEDVYWPCDYCDYKTKRRYELKLHFAADHEGRRFHCDHCDFSAKRKDKLNLHIRVVHEGLGKKCDYCDYSAGTNQHLLRHMRSKHSDVEGVEVDMLKCNECEEEFSRQEKLNDHIKRVHLGVLSDHEFESSDISSSAQDQAQQKCSECDFTAPTKGKLNEHYKSVHGGRKYKCDECNFECLTHGGLYLHQKAVHLGIRFKCDKCNYEGTQEVNLKRHIESKHGTVLYCCKLCNVKTKGSWYFETHLKKKHGVLDKQEYNLYLELKDIEPQDRWSSLKMDAFEKDEDNMIPGEGIEVEDTNDSDSYIDPSELLDQSNVLDEDEDYGEDDELGNELEPIVEINMTEDDDSYGVPDLELFEPSVVINLDDDDSQTVNTAPAKKIDASDQINETSALKHKNPKFTCRKCGFIANSSGTLTRHVSVVHRGIRWSCKLCGYVTTVKCSMVRHIQSIHQGWRYQCPFCDHESTQKGGLKYHIEKKHPTQYPVPKWSSLAPVKSKETSQIPGIEHMDVNEMFDEICNPYPDGTGPTDFITNVEDESDGVDPVQIMNNDSNTTEIDGCSVTDRMASDSGTEDFLMMEPAVEITEESGENDPSHDDEDMFVDMLDSLKDTQYVGEDHDFSELYAKFSPTGDEEVQCDLCTYVTSRMGNMRRHVLAVHQGIRFPCGQCNYRAPDKGSLLRHTRGVHEGIRYFCDFCSYSATQKGNLKKHQELKHGENCYSCMYCDFKINWKGSFIKHMQNHHGDLMNLQALGLNAISNPLNAFNMSNFVQQFPNGNDHDSGDNDHELSLQEEPIEEPSSEISLNADDIDHDNSVSSFKSQNMSKFDKDLEKSRVVIKTEESTFSSDKTDVNNAEVALPLNIMEDCGMPGGSLDPDNMTFDCSLCDYKANSSASLARHNGAIHKGIRWKCKDCEFITRDKSSLKRHRRNRHEGIRFQCNYCDYDAGQKGNIKSHMDRKHPEILYDHTEFQEVRIEKSKYSREAKQQDSEISGFQGAEAFNVNPMAGIGSMMPFNAHILSTFLQAKLREDSNFVSTDDDSSTGYNSKLSNRDEFTDPSDKDDEIRVVHPDDCDYSYDNIAEDSDEPEIITNESISKSNSPKLQEIEEENCGLDMQVTTEEPPQLSSLKSEPHSNSFKDSNSILLSALQSMPSSSSSPSLTPRKSLLDLLQLKDSIDKPEYLAKTNLLDSLKQSPSKPRSPTNRLKRYNHGSPVNPVEIDPEGTLPCPECHFMARSQGTLFRHIQSIHRGVRFNCPYCDFVTIDKGSLKRHVNGQHEGIKHKCDFCDYENAQIGNVKKHIQTKHQNIVYHCPYCSLEAKHKWYLEQHVKKLHGDKLDEFDVKAVIPRVAESVVAPALQFNPQLRDPRSATPGFTPDPSYFLEMFGHHPMAQFFVPDAHKAGGGDELDIDDDEIEEEECTQIKTEDTDNSF